MSTNRSNLTPVQRPDRNGKVTTRWVKPSVQADNAARLPAPASLSKSSPKEDHAKLYGDVRRGIFDHSPKENWQSNLSVLQGCKIFSPDSAELYRLFQDNIDSPYEFYAIEEAYRALKDNGVEDAASLINDDALAAVVSISVAVQRKTKPLRELSHAAIMSGELPLAVRLIQEHHPETAGELEELIERYRDITVPLHNGVL